MQHILRIGDREITSGHQGEALASVRCTSRVNRGEGFAFGSVCPALTELSLIELSQPILPGEKLELLDRDKKLLGTYYCLQAEQSGGLTKITAYDSLYFLEKDVTDWLLGLDCWPYTLEDFAHLICQQCGVTLADEPVPNGNYAIGKFTGSATGRALLCFVAEAAGCFVQADAEGVVHFRWYERKETPVLVCFARSMQNFTVAPADQVQLQGSAQDVGVIYPDSQGTNTYQVTGNPLLTGEILPIAQSLFERLQDVSYTPGVLRVAECDLRAGDVFSLEGQDFYVMQTVRSAEGLEISCFGQEKFGSVAVRNQEKFSSLTGKVLELTARVEGLLAENRDAAGNLARLSLSLEGISTQVAAQSEEAARLSQSVSQIDQKADGISLSVSQMQQEGVARVQTAFGLTLDGSALTIAREGSEMENRLDETGMYVCRGEDVMLRANASGVLATDVTVRNYLAVGDHARFEDYGADRTACFYQ